MCTCVKCLFGRLVGVSCDADARREFGLQRGESLVAAYMAQNDCERDVAVAALQDQAVEQWRELAVIYGRRHGLDEDDTVSALLTYGIDGPGVMQ